MSGDRDDDPLWDAVKKTAKPLHKPRDGRPAEKTGKEIKASGAAPRSRPAPVLAPAKIAPRPALPPLAPLDRRARSRIARGAVEIEARLDLHGYRLAEAKERLAHFLEQAQAREKSLVLVITGKGTIKGAAAPEGAERGVLKREVPLWLGSPAFRPLVIGFEQAASAHGGAGALYVRVRRRR
jgi:DNA-nicking Smr family endonuclease